jgi:hypothetical protein
MLGGARFGGVERGLRRKPAEKSAIHAWENHLFNSVTFSPNPRFNSMTPSETVN